jgi:hypothetical protein
MILQASDSNLGIGIEVFFERGVTKIHKDSTPKMVTIPIMDGKTMGFLFFVAK